MFLILGGAPCERKHNLRTKKEVWDEQDRNDFIWSQWKVVFQNQRTCMGLKSNIIASWVSSHSGEVCVGLQSWVSERQKQILGLLKMQFFISEAAFPAPHLALSVVQGMLSVMVPPISTLNTITTMEPMPSSARGGLGSAIKLKFRFWLITAEVCDSEGKAYSLTHANGCYHPVPQPARASARHPCHCDLPVFAGLSHNMAGLWHFSNRKRY